MLALFPPGVSRASLAAAAERIRFQRGLAERFRDGLVRAGQWEPLHPRGDARTRALPQELAALPHVESSFNPSAYSHAGAAGLWQFMPGTGKQYLRIDRAVDERYDPWKSSEAAAKLLGANYRVTGAWPLAITAYNHGAGGMMRAVKQLGTQGHLRHHRPLREPQLRLRVAQLLHRVPRRPRRRDGCSPPLRRALAR